MCDFTWLSSGGVNTSWWATSSITNTGITWASDQRQRIISIGKWRVRYSRHIWGSSDQWLEFYQTGIVNLTFNLPISYSSNHYAAVTCCSSTSTKGAQAYGIYGRDNSSCTTAGYGCSPGTSTIISIGK